jgi:hypothetical protein
MYSKVRIGKHLPDNFPIRNGLKQGDALSPLIFNFAIEYAIMKVQENQVDLPFQCSFLVSFTCVRFNVVCSCTLKRNTEKNRIKICYKAN